MRLPWLLIINEFQELIEFKTVQERQLIANAFKYISEEARVPIVLVGMPWAEQIAEEPQWSSRLVRRRKLEYFSLQKDSKYYRQYLMGLAKYMPFEEPPKLEDKHVAIPLFAACRGENRILKHFLLEALKNALLAGANTLENQHFADAYTTLFNRTSGTVSNNPFTQPIEDILISEVFEYSRYNSNALSAEEMLIARVFSKPQTLAQLLSK
ncbi:TniB family NTP-binding protein [Shewanella sp.]|uniref:TniB family NTP-binding protein n=1 Tax=Shewanella sp. TaxID=50422 RepID=UPI00257E97D0|nr:TniB family NTP-binding protein [Shewanella sp.]